MKPLFVACWLVLSMLTARTSSAQEPTCREVAHIGDSLTAYTKHALANAYRAVGVTARVDAFGGRGTMQKLRRDPQTGRQAAKTIARAGFSGCWVIALGTNDTANVHAGASYTRATAIDEMMRAIDPSGRAIVVWVSAFTTRSTGHWSNANMELWNQALRDAGERWPNLRVFDWASIARTGAAPFADGIHHTKQGYAVRNRAIAEAVAQLR
jgi:lysophospholipase L1-like esterase